MATKAAKSITINATKYELANALDYQNGKVQLKAKDVLLSEVEVGDSDFVITLAENQNFASAGSKTLAESFAASDLEAAIKAGKRIKVLVPKFENMNESGYTDYAVITPDAYYDFSAAQFELVFGHYDNYHQTVSVKMLVCAGFGTVSSVTLV